MDARAETALDLNDMRNAKNLIGILESVATTQSHYIKTASPDAIAAMRQFSEALLCSTFAPDGDVKAKGPVQ